MRFRLARNVRGDRHAKLIRTQFLEGRVAECLIVHRGRSKLDQRLARRLAVPIGVSPADPECQQPQHAPRALKPRQSLPLALEDGDYRWMEGVRACKDLGRCFRADASEFARMVAYPLGVSGYGVTSFVRQPAPLE